MDDPWMRLMAIYGHPGTVEEVTWISVMTERVTATVLPTAFTERYVHGQVPA
jgi:hypothetical protein